MPDVATIADVPAGGVVAVDSTDLHELTRADWGVELGELVVVQRTAELAGGALCWHVVDGRPVPRSPRVVALSCPVLHVKSIPARLARPLDELAPIVDPLDRNPG